MRSREEIRTARDDAVVAGYAAEVMQDLTLEVLLDIRDLLGAKITLSSSPPLMAVKSGDFGKPPFGNES